MKFYTILLTLALFIASCEKRQEAATMDCPLATIVKLESAEAYKDYNAAMNYIDIEKVYSAIAIKENKTSEQVWKEFLEFKYTVGKSNKFVSTFPLHKYKISKIIKENTAEVQFTGTEEGQRIKVITYRLTLENKSWKVVAIEYKKQNYLQNNN